MPFNFSFVFKLAYQTCKIENHPHKISVGCANLQGPSTCRWIWHTILRNSKYDPSEVSQLVKCTLVLTAAICSLQSAKTNLNVEQVFFSIARDIKQRLADTDSRAEVIESRISYGEVWNCSPGSLILMLKLFSILYFPASDNQNQSSRPSCRD